MISADGRYRVSCRILHLLLVPAMLWRFSVSNSVTRLLSCLIFTYQMQKYSSPYLICTCPSTFVVGSILLYIYLPFKMLSLWPEFFHKLHACYFKQYSCLNNMHSSLCIFKECFVMFLAKFSPLFERASSSWNSQTFSLAWDELSLLIIPVY